MERHVGSLGAGTGQHGMVEVLEVEGLGTLSAFTFLHIGFCTMELAKWVFGIHSSVIGVGMMWSLGWVGSVRAPTRGPTRTAVFEGRPPQAKREDCGMISDACRVEKGPCSRSVTPHLGSSASLGGREDASRSTSAHQRHLRRLADILNP